MVDVSGKSVTQREAHARSIVILPAEVIEQVSNEEIDTKKGPVFATAIIAGVRLKIRMRSSIAAVR
jgi:cyclic pyranopterin phosphate synthase